MQGDMSSVLFALLLFIASVVPSQAQMRRVEAVAGAPLRLQCPLRVEAAASWRFVAAGAAEAAETEPPRDLTRGERAGAAGGGLLAELSAAAARAHHAGRYRCGAGPDQALELRVLPRAAAEAAAEAGGAADEAPELVYDVGHEVVFSCDLDNPAGLPYVWKVNDTSLEAVAALKGRTRLEQGGARLVLPARTAEDDFGNYTCAVGGASRGWRLRGRPHVKLPANTNVVEGQKVKLQCRLYGKPYPPVVWLYVNGSDAAQNATDALAALGERASLQPNEQGVPGAELVLERVQRGDAGQLLCAVLGGDEAARAATTLRVKDMYAALWPFLGICAEVFVLCAIILIYEKRRTKPELDDSDTDTHDQKKS